MLFGLYLILLMLMQTWWISPIKCERNRRAWVRLSDKWSMLVYQNRVDVNLQKHKTSIQLRLFNLNFFFWCFTFRLNVTAIVQELRSVIAYRGHDTSPLCSSFMIYTIPWMFKKQQVSTIAKCFFKFWETICKYYVMLLFWSWYK